MKNLKYIFVMLITVLSISSCDVPVDVEFDHVYKSDLQIDVPDGSKGFLFDVNTILDPASSADYAKYADLIKDISINGIKGLVGTVNKTVTVKNLELVLESNGQEVSFQTPSMLFEEGATVTFESVAGEFDIISEWMKNKQAVNIQMRGESSEDDFQCTFSTETSVTVIADPLD